MTIGETESTGRKRVQELLEIAATVIGSRELAHHWLHTPRTIFGGLTPRELAESETGAKEVQDLLHRVEHGVFS